MQGTFPSPKLLPRFQWEIQILGLINLTENYVRKMDPDHFTAQTKLKLSIKCNTGLGLGIESNNIPLTQKKKENKTHLKDFYSAQEQHKKWVCEFMS